MGIEVCDLVGGAEELSKIALVLCESGKIDAATHFIEWCMIGNQNNVEIHKIRSKIYRKRVEEETSLMAKGIYLSEQLKSEKFLGTPKYYANKIEGYVIEMAEKKNALFELSIISYRIKLFFRTIVEYMLIWKLILFLYSLFPEMPFSIVRKNKKNV